MSTTKHVHTGQLLEKSKGKESSDAYNASCCAYLPEIGPTVRSAYDALALYVRKKALATHSYRNHPLVEPGTRHLSHLVTLNASDPPSRIHPITYMPPSMHPATTTSSPLPFSALEPLWELALPRVPSASQPLRREPAARALTQAGSSTCPAGELCTPSMCPP